MFSKTLKAFAVATVLSATAATAYAYPTPYQRQIDVQLNNVINVVRNAGFNLIIANQRGEMYSGYGTASFIVNLQAGADYRFEARCDQDCSDLDLSLRDANGNELISDRDYDDIPGFSFRAPYTGAYRVNLELARCNAYRCQVGAVVLGRTI